MSEFVIEDGIPLPAETRGRKAGPLMATIKRMKPGQSVLVPEHPNKFNGSLGGLVKRGFKLKRAKVGDGFRLWVLKNPLLEGGA